MLSESATVAPLSPVPVGVCSSFDCELERGMLRKDRFFFGSPVGTAAPSSAGSVLDGVLRTSSVDGPRDDDGGGITVVVGSVALAARERVSRHSAGVQLGRSSRVM
jgi:hypothetical protein